MVSKTFVIHLYRNLLRDCKYIINNHLRHHIRKEIICQFHKNKYITSEENIKMGCVILDLIRYQQNRYREWPW